MNKAATQLATQIRETGKKIGNPPETWFAEQLPNPKAAIGIHTPSRQYATALLQLQHDTPADSWHETTSAVMALLLMIGIATGLQMQTGTPTP